MAKVEKIATRIKGLDGLRAIAVALVVLNHNFYFKFHLLSGGAGVRLFFVLSGFLIISILHRRRIALENKVSTLKIELRHFYENRFFRIWPIYFAALAIAVATIAYQGERLDVISWFGNILFLGNVLVAYHWFSWHQVGALWSVAVEEQFYLWAGFVFLLLPSRWHGRVCVAILVMAAIAAYATTIILSDATHRQISIYTGSLTNFGLIALGGGTALLIKPNMFCRVLAAPCLAVYLALVLSGSLMALPGPFFFAMALPIALILVGIAGAQTSLLTRLLDLPPLRYIGRVSYGIYLLHPLLHLELLPGLGWLTNHMTVLAIANTCASVAGASASWHFFESAILRVRDRRRQREVEVEAVKQETFDSAATVAAAAINTNNSGHS